MFLVSLFRTSNLFIYINYTQILQLLNISTQIKYFSNSYVICTSNNNDISDKMNKRKFNEIKEEELASLSAIKYNKIEDKSTISGLLQESEIYIENSSKNNHPEKVFISNNNIDKDINNFFDKVLVYLEKNIKIHNSTILIYFREIKRIYELNSNIINKKKLLKKSKKFKKKLLKKVFY